MPAKILQPSIKNQAKLLAQQNTKIVNFKPQKNPSHLPLTFKWEYPAGAFGVSLSGFEQRSFDILISTWSIVNLEYLSWKLSIRYCHSAKIPAPSKTAKTRIQFVRQATDVIMHEVYSSFSLAISFNWIKQKSEDKIFKFIQHYKHENAYNITQISPRLPAHFKISCLGWWPQQY